MHFDGLFNRCSTVRSNRRSLKTVVRSRVVLYSIFKKENIGLTLRKGRGGSAFIVNLMLSVNKSISNDPLDTDDSSGLAFFEERKHR